MNSLPRIDVDTAIDGTSFPSHKRTLASYLIASVFIADIAAAIVNTVLMLIALFVVGFGISSGQPRVNAVGADAYPRGTRPIGLSWAYGVGRICLTINPTTAVGGV